MTDRQIAITADALRNITRRHLHYTADRLTALKGFAETPEAIQQVAWLQEDVQKALEAL